MGIKESWLERAARLEAEHEVKQTVEEWKQSRLRWEDWETLLPELVEFAKLEIRRRRWRGDKLGMLPEGHDANSVAAEAIQDALSGKARLALGWTRERLMKELRRKVSNEVRRLHKLKETRKVRSEWEVLVSGPNGELRSVFDWMKGHVSGARIDGELDERDKIRKEIEQRIAEKLSGGDPMMEMIFSCLREGVVKRREIAAKLGKSVGEVTNGRKRLDRKLDELGKAGMPGWAIEEWKQK